MSIKEEEKIKKEFEVDELRIFQEILEQPVLYLKHAIRSARATRKLREIQFQTKVVAAEEMKSIREDYFTDNNKHLAMTAPIDKEYLPHRKKYKAQVQKQIEAEEEADILKAMKEAARDRKDMLVSYSMMYREELNSEIKIRKKE